MWKTIRPWLFRHDPEQMHELTVNLLEKLGILLPDSTTKTPEVEVWFRSKKALLQSPIGLAAGFDKNGRLPRVMGKFGFGFEEVGSIVNKPTQGNPKPRMFRLEQEQALVNRMGLNSLGSEAVCERLDQTYETRSLPIAINISRSPNLEQNEDPLQDIVESFNHARRVRSLLYIAINISCPNTKSGIVTEAKWVLELMRELNRHRTDIAVFFKLSPDSTEEFLQVVVPDTQHYVDGWVCGNTANPKNLFNLSEDTRKQLEHIGVGGLSGKPLKTYNLALLERVAQLKHRSQTLIACGGITGLDDILHYYYAGASLFQLYTGFVYEGPNLVHKLNRDLHRIMNAKEGLEL